MAKLIARSNGHANSNRRKEDGAGMMTPEDIVYITNKHGVGWHSESRYPHLKQQDVLNSDRLHHEGGVQPLQLTHGNNANKANNTPTPIYIS